MTRDELIRKLMKIGNPKSRVDLRIVVPGPDFARDGLTEEYLTEVSDVQIARDGQGRDIVEITNGR